MTGSARRLPWSLVAPIPSATPGSFFMGRRTLYRALPVTLEWVTPSSLHCFRCGRIRDEPVPPLNRVATSKID
jgi:hypothetical protein